MGGVGTLPWLVRAGQCPRRRWNADAGDAGYGGIAGAGTLYTLLWKFPAFAPIAVESPYGSFCAEGYREE